ncbi:MAG: 1-acyl-sn-glycerol-3-phosphate acyltransferase [Pseudomonadota bacterium]
MKQWLCKGVFNVLGYTHNVNPEAVSDDKSVIIGFPHTSNTDTVLALALFNILNIPYHVLVKKELFFFPLSFLLRGVGCLPVDRNSSKNIVDQMVSEFEQREQFSLVVAPEATRGKAGQQRVLRTGFWHIAKAANVPIVLMRLDLDDKHGTIFDKIQPSEDITEDIERITEIYAKHNIDIPKPRQPS